MNNTSNTLFLLGLAALFAGCGKTAPQDNVSQAYKTGPDDPDAFTKIQAGRYADNGLIFIGDDENGSHVYTSMADETGTYTWGDAVKTCAASNESGYNNWRVPTETELTTMCALSYDGDSALAGTFQSHAESSAESSDPSVLPGGHYSHSN